jgi:hypothetical protein
MSQENVEIVRPIYAAWERLNKIVEGLKRADTEAQGEVTHAEGQGNWLERGVVTTAKSSYFQPVNHILVAGG